MTAPRRVDPRRVPAVGDVLQLASGQCRYVDRPLWVRVLRARPEISVYYDGDWCWADVDVLGAGGVVVERRPVLVHVDAVPGAQP